MSRSLKQKCCHSSLSESVLQRGPLYLTATSDDEVSSIRRSRSSSPFLTSVHRCIEEPSTKCCLCCQCNKKKSSKSLINNDLKKTSAHRSQKLRESLELQLITTQVEEALTDDKQATLVQRLDLATSALEALTQYLQALRITHHAAYRVLDISYSLIYLQSSSTNHSVADLRTYIQQAKNPKEGSLSSLEDLIEFCSKNISVSKQLHSIMSDHKTRKKDFFVAAKNFKSLLDNSKLSTSQMEKLHEQYNDILNDYQQSRCILDAELPKVVNARLEALRQGFAKIIKFFANTDFDKQITFFKLIGENLCRDNSVKESCGRETQTAEICQKCKVNWIEKK